MNFSLRFKDHADDHASEIDYAVSMMFSASHLPSGTTAEASQNTIPQRQYSFVLPQAEMPRQQLSLRRN